jgi:hypothetical protein
MLKKIIAFCLVFLAINSYANTTLNDPTRPFGTPLGSANQGITTSIDAILAGKQRSFVMVSGQRFKIGDKLMGGEIVAIHTNEIVLRDSSGEYKVQMIGQTIKKQAVQK